MEREQFTFYRSFAQAVKRIKKAADRAAAYDAIVDYALYGIEPNMEKLPDTAAIAFELVRPNLDASRRKAESGKAGGKRKANAKQSDAADDFASADGESKPEARENGKQTGSKPEANAKQEQTASKKEKEKEVEIEGEKENECYISPQKEKLKESAPLFPAEKKQSESKTVLTGEKRRERIRHFRKVVDSFRNQGFPTDGGYNLAAAEGITRQEIDDFEEGE